MLPMSETLYPMIFVFLKIFRRTSQRFFAFMVLGRMVFSESNLTLLIIRVVQDDSIAITTDRRSIYNNSIPGWLSARTNLPAT